jgi:hypothetical protein
MGTHPSADTSLVQCSPPKLSIYIDYLVELPRCKQDKFGLPLRLAKNKNDYTKYEILNQNILVVHKMPIFYLYAKNKLSEFLIVLVHKISKLIS